MKPTVLHQRRLKSLSEMQFERDAEEMTQEELEKHIKEIKKKMEKAAADLNFEAAAEYRDRLIELKNMLRDM